MTSMRDSSSNGIPAHASSQAATVVGRVLRGINWGRSWAATHPIPVGFVACLASIMFLALIYGEASSEEDAEVEATQPPALATDDSLPPKSDGTFFVKERAEQASTQRAPSLPPHGWSQADMEARGRESEFGHSMACVLRAYAENTGLCENTQLGALAKAIKSDESTYVYNNKTYKWSELFVSHGVEWVLWLLADAKIPLLTIHGYMVGFPEPACIPVTEMIPLAISSVNDSKLSSGQRPNTEFERSECKYESLTKITPDEAKIALVLTKHAVRRDTNLVFKSLRDLTPESATVLASHRHSLEFPRLASLSIESARALAQHRGGFTRTGAWFDDSLVLGLSELSPEVAAAIAGKKGSLQIGTKDRPLKIISRETAESLAKFNGRFLTLWASDVPTDAQDALAACGSRIRFAGGPSTLSSTKLVQKLIEGADGGLISLGCGRMTPDAALFLRQVGSGCAVNFGERFDCDPAVATELARYPGEITFIELVAVPEALGLLKAALSPQASPASTVGHKDDAKPEKHILPGMPGSTEAELIQAYGPVLTRIDTDGGGKKLGFLHKGVAVGADMPAGEKTCQQITLIFIGRNNQAVKLDRSVQDALEAKLKEVTGHQDWLRGPNEVLDMVLPEYLMRWTSSSVDASAFVPKENPRYVVIYSTASEDK